MTPVVTVPQLGWMAGVVDMKGRVRKLMAPSRSSPMFTLMVETTQLKVVRRLAGLTGTRVAYSEKRSLTVAFRRGCVEHCPEAHQHINPVMPTVGRWHISGAGAIIVLDQLMPYLTGDTDKMREFIDEAMSWIQPPGKGRGRHAIDQSIRRMEKLGWDIPDELGEPVLLG